MKRHTLCIALTAILLMGCSSVKYVGENELISFEELNQKVAGKRAIIVFSAGHFLVVQDVKMDADSTSWMQPGLSTRQYSATSDIHQIELNRRGGLRGFAIGFLAGAATGAMFGFGEGSDPSSCRLADHNCSFFSFSASDKAIIYGSTIGLSTGLIGLIIGRTNGSKIIYHNASGKPQSNDAQ